MLNLLCSCGLVIFLGVSSAGFAEGEARGTVKRTKIIEAPSNLGLKNTDYAVEPGVYKMPDALRKAGLARAVKADAVVRVERLPYAKDVDVPTGIRNADSIRIYSKRVAEAVREAITDDYFPLVIGGDCSILLGNLLALRTLGQYGLLFIDGHNDFQTPEISSTHGAAGMDLALVTGRGPELLCNIDGLKPYVADGNVVVMGDRYENPDARANQAIRETDITVYTLSTLRKIRLQRALNETLKKFRESSVRGVWIHVDTDVLNDEIMPAVDSRQPDGLTYEELLFILRSVLSSGLAIGMDITIYDPDLDRSGKYAVDLVKLLEKSFSIPFLKEK